MLDEKEIDEIARVNYDKDTYSHAYRVSLYAVEISERLGLSNLERHLIGDIALLHDVLEDTDFDILQYYQYQNSVNKVPDYYDTTLWKVVQLLTRDKAIPYEDYLYNLKDNKYAYIVKLADMKDHLSLKETLTPKLKEKYLNGLAVLL